MNIEHVRAFLEVAETGRFQDAAEKLNVTQSTISARIKTLEERLNGPLFVRDRKGVSLTEMGRHFHRHALTVVLAWERARQEAALPQEIRALVSLGLQYDQWSSILIPWLAWMGENAPEIAPRVVADYSDKLVQQLRDGLIDLAVVFQVQYGPDLIVEKLRDESLVLVSTAEDQTDIEAVPGYIYMDWGEVFRAEHNMLFPNMPAFRFSVGVSSVGLGHILAHGGSGYFLERDVEPPIAEGRLHRVDRAPVLQIPTNLVYPRAALDDSVIMTAIDGLRRSTEATSD